MIRRASGFAVAALLSLVPAGISPADCEAFLCLYNDTANQCTSHSTQGPLSPGSPLVLPYAESQAGGTPSNPRMRGGSGVIHAGQVHTFVKAYGPTPWNLFTWGRMEFDVDFSGATGPFSATLNLYYVGNRRHGGPSTPGTDFSVWAGVSPGIGGTVHPPLPVGEISYGTIQIPIQVTNPGFPVTIEIRTEARVNSQTSPAGSYNYDDAMTYVRLPKKVDIFTDFSPPQPGIQIDSTCGAIQNNRWNGIPAGSIMQPPGPAPLESGSCSPFCGLTVDRGAGGDLDLSWDASCLGDDTDYAVYEGSIGNYYSHETVQCSTEGLTTTAITPSSGNRYYLVVPRNLGSEGSYGMDSGGNERPPCTTVCAGTTFCAPHDTDGCP